MDICDDDRLDTGGVRIAAESVRAQVARKAQADADRLMSSWFASELDRFDEDAVKAAARRYAL